MNVSASQPFQIIYSLFQHEFLGYLFESFVVHLDENGKLTFQHQNISAKNAKEFASGLDASDYKLIELMDSMQQDAVVKHFHKKYIKPEEFFLKIYDDQKGNKLLQEEIEKYVERRRSNILPLLIGKQVYEMGRDGEPAWKKIDVLENKASVLFHFRRNEDNTHYFPTIKYDGEKVEFQYKGAFIICKDPAWMVLSGKLYNFEKEVDGKKLSPFLNKKFIVIPKNVEETYYNKFVAPLIATFDVYAKGFEINTDVYHPEPVLSFSEIVSTKQSTMTLFGNGEEEEVIEDDSKILFELSFNYGQFHFKADHIVPVSVSVEKNEDQYIFHKVRRNLENEKEIAQELKIMGLHIRNAKVSMSKTEAFQWLNDKQALLDNFGIKLIQKSKGGKKYFLGTASLSVEVNENIDWFDINAIIKFGEYEVPFIELRKMMLKKQAEFDLPNGETAVIPENWYSEYEDLFAFSENGDEQIKLKKHHIALVQELENGNLAKVNISRKLEQLKNFDAIEASEMPTGFTGNLRPYQTAGYNWMQFLNQFNFGGCLADDMGLGKTVQTLTLLQSQKESGQKGATLLVMPTSLIYNWEKEAKKFTPDLKVFAYTGTQRKKDVTQFDQYDLVITSYGIVRLDIEILQQYYFNYVILDESQAIKNPTSNIAKSVNTLNSRHRLILTGTPLENSTMDLWSQISFINPGLLGNKNFFKKEFLIPIEKKNDEGKTKRLYSIIKPFIMRRHKSQVATELPPKSENIQYSSMTKPQQEQYEEVKAYYRNQILEQIDTKGIGKSQLLLLQGLTKLRQIANHPKMVDPNYDATSGKIEDLERMLDNALKEGHKVLIFSQFVKHLTLISNLLNSKEINFSYLDGSTKDRAKQVENFQSDKNLKVFLISLKAGGLGLNLTEADYVFLMDPWWNPAIEAQAVDRAHRIGQKNRVFTYKFITKDTVEEKILELQKHKLKLASDLITTEESFVKKLTKADIESLLT